VVCFSQFKSPYLLLEHGDFLNNISQAVATVHLRCGGIFDGYFTANLIPTLPVNNCENHEPLAELVSKV